MPYGPWIQGPDYEKANTAHGSGATGLATASVNGLRPSDDELNTAIAAVSGDSTIDSFTGNLIAGLGIGSVTRDNVAGTAQLDAEGLSGGGWWGEGVDESLLQPPSYPLPPGAIGFQREGTSSVPLSAVLTFAPQHEVTAPLSAAPTQIRVTAGTAVGSELVLVDEWSFDLADNGVGAERVINLTPHMDPTTGNTSIRVVAYKNGVWAFVTPDDPTPSGSTMLFANPVMTHTLRPPRHRFLYPDPLVTRQPPCRRYPGGATTNNLARRYPPLPVRQRSNRKSDPY